MDCLFCQIIQGKVPAYKIYEDKKTLAFLDINPVTRGHSLVVPKKHSENLFEMAPEDAKSLMLTIQKVSSLLKQKLGADGVNILHASGKTAEQSVFHTHFHLVPRYKDDKLHLFPRDQYTKGDFEDIVKLILS